MSERLVITGAGGQLGSSLAARAARQGRDVVALTSSQWDITDAGAAERFVQRGDVVVNCAAYTNVDAAESEEAAAFAVNAAGPEHIARACAHAGARLIHISTDYVFCGAVNPQVKSAEPRPYEPSDETAPLGVYACSKLAGEKAVLAALPEASQACVVRTAWLYTGGTGKDFVAVMARLAAGDGPVDVVDDQVGSPTYVADLADAVLEVADGRARGPILHAANQGAVSRFEEARAVFAACGADPQRVRPVTTAQYPTRPAPRPYYSALGSRQSAEAGLTPLRPWRSALVAALEASHSRAFAERPLPSTRD